MNSRDASRKAVSHIKERGIAVRYLRRKPQHIARNSGTVRLDRLTLSELVRGRFGPHRPMTQQTASDIQLKRTRLSRKPKPTQKINDNVVIVTRV